MTLRRRIDIVLMERGIVPTRAVAQALIRAGKVRVEGRVFDKPGMSVALDAAIEVQAAPQFVGRGGEKLSAALDGFGLDPDGLICLDVGASTGGFTDALLQRGAAQVFAVDVGRAQLAWRLRSDPRVVNLERMDIRNLPAPSAAVALVAVDVAFIGLDRVLPAVHDIVKPGVRCVALVKPQFEAGRGRVGRGGVVRDPAVHRDVVERITTWCRGHGWRVLDALPSPLLGADGNREFFLLLAKGAVEPDDPAPDSIVACAMSPRPTADRG